MRSILRGTKLCAIYSSFIVLFTTFIILMYTLLKDPASTPEGNNQTSPYVCQDKFKVILPSSSVTMFNSFALDESQALFVHFHVENLSRLVHSTEILDPLNLVWVESVSAPFLSLDLAYNVYSLTTLQRKVHHMSVSVECISQKSLNNITASCLTSILADAFLNNVSHERGALCYVVDNSENLFDTVKYRCCKTEFNAQQITCDVPASNNPEMTGIFSTIAVMGIIFFLCFPVVTVHFPDEDDSSQTISANRQVCNPLYRIFSTVVKILRNYSGKYYLFDVVRKLLIGLSLPTLYYIDLGLKHYTAKHDIPKMFNDAVNIAWQNNEIKDAFVFSTIAFYNFLVILISIIPAAEKLDFSTATDSYQQKSSEILKAGSHECDWTKPYHVAKRLLRMRYHFYMDRPIIIRGFVYLLALPFLPFITILIFIGYGLYISPLGQMISLLCCRAQVYSLWLYRRCGRKAILSEVLFVPTLNLFLLALAAIITRSLLVISRFISYFIMGIVASKDDFLPLIALFSLFLFYIWNCVSSVGKGYKDLLNHTFNACKEYQEKENRQVITVDRKGTPRIAHLSDLFQKVVNEIQPFSKTYTVMCLRIVIIACFLSITYCSILVFGKTSLNDVTKTLAVSLAGLIPKLVELFRSDNTKELIDKENSYRVRAIVFAVIDSEWRQNQDISQEEPTRNCPDNTFNTGGDGNSRLLTVHSELCREITPLPSNGDPGDIV